MQQNRSVVGPSFGVTLLSALALGAIVAAILSPLISYPLALAGFRFPFPRVFDRVTMVAIGGALLWFANSLRLGDLLRAGFTQPLSSINALMRGFAVGLSAILALFILVLLATRQLPSSIALGVRALEYLPAALLIAVIEEGFFRAILLGGLMRRWSRRDALVASSMIYAAAHLVHGPKRFYLIGFHPLAGFSTLFASLVRILMPAELLGMVFGLFLLGLVLGRAFLLTGRVYVSIGLHAAMVVGAKSWPIVRGSATVPWWLAGPGSVPLIAAPAGWLIAMILFGLLRRGLMSPADATTAT